jgi:hypothetical protein
MNATTTQTAMSQEQRAYTENLLTASKRMANELRNEALATNDFNTSNWFVKAMNEVDRICELLDNDDLVRSIIHD